MYCCPKKNSQDAAVLTTLKAVQNAVLTALKAVQDAEKKTTLTKTKYKDLFPSFSP
jgi:heat shock protein HslJ